MVSFNRVVLMGNLTRDPDLKYLPNQTPVCQFGMAINRKYTSNGEQREDVTFVDCGAFGKLAEVINQYCQKGKAVLVEGRLKYDQWEDRQGGGKRSKLSVVVDSCQFIGGSGGEGDGNGGRQRAPQQSQQRQQYPRTRPQQVQEPAPFSDTPEFQEDEIPF